MSKLDRSFVYKKFKRVLLNQFSKEIADSVWKEASAVLSELIKKHRNIGADEKMMVLPLYALYATLRNHGIENAFELLQEYGKQRGNDFSELISKFTSFPGVSKLLWRNMPKLMRKSSSPKKGYERRIVSETNELVGVDILKCPLYEMAKQLGAPEIASIVCLIDKGQMSGFKYIDYTRTKAIGEGEDYCDYRLKYNQNKK